MKNINSAVSVRQVKAARALLDWSQEDLAEHSAVSIPTVRRLEAADGILGGRSETSTKLVAALEAAGVKFIPENGGVGVRLRDRSGPRSKGKRPETTLSNNRRKIR